MGRGLRPSNPGSESPRLLRQPYAWPLSTARNRRTTKRYKSSSRRRPLAVGDRDCAARGAIAHLSSEARDARAARPPRPADVESGSRVKRAPRSGLLVTV